MVYILLTYLAKNTFGNVLPLLVHTGLYNDGQLHDRTEHKSSVVLGQTWRVHVTWPDWQVHRLQLSLKTSPWAVL